MQEPYESARPVHTCLVDGSCDRTGAPATNYTSRDAVVGLFLCFSAWEVGGDPNPPRAATRLGTTLTVVHGSLFVGQPSMLALNVVRPGVMTSPGWFAVQLCAMWRSGGYHTA